MRWVFVLLGLLLFAGGFSPAQEWKHLENKFLNEAPPAWKQYLDNTSTLQGTQVQTGKLNKEGVFHHRRYEIKQRANCFLCLEEMLIEAGKKSNRKQLWARNSQYEFELLRESSKAKGWALREVRMPPPETIPRFSAPALVEGFLSAPVTFSVFSGSLRIVTGDPGFEVKQVTSVKNQKNEFLKVHFRYHPNGQNPRIPSIQGWIVYEPSKYWLMHEYDAELVYPPQPALGSKQPRLARRSGKFEYAATAAGLPVVKMFFSTIANRTTGNTIITKTEYDLHEGDPPESDFMLPAFGLPHPPSYQPPSNPSRWYLWFAGIAAVSLIVGFYLLRRSGRPSAATPASGS